MNKLILVRHGQSTYNLENKFTGWKDVGLTEKGIREATECSKLLANLKINKCAEHDLELSRKCDELYLGFIIPRKLGSAVSRNKFKKRCRHAISSIHKTGKLPGVGVVVKPQHAFLKQIQGFL